LIASGSDIEIRQSIDDERRRLRKNFEIILDEVDGGDYNSLWSGYLKMFDSSLNFLGLVDQISRYQPRYWGNISPLFEEIYALTEHQNSTGKKDLVDYFFYSLLELIGGILLEKKAFKLLNSLLDIKRLDYRREGMEPILAWKWYAEFIRIKGDKEFIETRNKRIFPHMHYLLQVVGTKDFPFDYDLRRQIIDVDLLYFVYSVIYPKGSDYPHWEPQSSPYLAPYGSDLLKRMKHDKVFGVQVAIELFEVQQASYEFLIRKLGEAKAIFKREVVDKHPGDFLVNPFNDF